jgi:hypothetical protein
MKWLIRQDLCEDMLTQEEFESCERWTKNVTDQLTAESLAWLQTHRDAGESVGDFIGQLAGGFNVDANTDDFDRNEYAANVAKLLNALPDAEDKLQSMRDLKMWAAQQVEHEAATAA